MDKVFSASDLNKKLGDVLDAAGREPVGISRHGKTRFVITSLEYFERLKARKDTRRAYRTEDLPSDVVAAILSSNADLEIDE